MKTTDINYLKICRTENKMFLERDYNYFESMTLDQWNKRHNTAFQSWDEFADDRLWSPDEILEYCGDKKLVFV